MLHLFSITYLQILEKYEDWKNEKCPKQPLCYRSQFLVSEDPLFLNLYGNMFSSNAPFDYFCRLSLKNQMSEAVTTEKSYSGQSLFGDIGGTLNMFLGFCGLGMIEMIITLSNVCGKRLRRTIIKCSVFFFWLVFVFFSTQAIVKYRRQPITTQTHFVKNNLTNEFPYLTFCAKSYAFTFVARNMGTQIQSFDGTIEKLPFKVAIGGSYKLKYVPLKWHLTYLNPIFFYKMSVAQI